MWMQEKPTGMHRPVCMDVERLCENIILDRPVEIDETE